MNCEQLKLFVHYMDFLGVPNAKHLLHRIDVFDNHIIFTKINEIIFSGKTLQIDVYAKDFLNHIEELAKNKIHVI